MGQVKYMKFILSTHNVTLTKSIEDHMLTRIEKLEHLDRFVTSARVTLEHNHLKGPERQFSCSIRLAVPGPDLFAEDRENDLYAAIDLVAKKIEQNCANAIISTKRGNTRWVRAARKRAPVLRLSRRHNVGARTYRFAGQRCSCGERRRRHFRQPRRVRGTMA